MALQFGIFTVGDVTNDPTTCRTPTEHERIKSMVAIGRKAEDVGLDVSLAASTTTRREDRRGLRDAQHLADGRVDLYRRLIMNADGNAPGGVDEVVFNFGGRLLGPLGDGHPHLPPGH